MSMESGKTIALSGRQRAPVLIIGAHRSGTTATARALQLLGLQIGQRLDSHHEPRGMQRLHEEYLHGVGASWFDPTAILKWVRTPEGESDCVAYLKKNIRKDFDSLLGYRKNPRGLWLRARMKFGQPWGWKEPRTTLFTSLWLQLFPDARIVHVVRHPLAVAQSLRRRELEFQKAGDPPRGALKDLDYCLRIAATYLEVGEQISAKTRHFYRIRFEDLQTDPGAALKLLGEFCQLRFTNDRVAEAVATIRTQNAARHHDITEETFAKLLSEHPTVTKLGYRWH
jgi:hypothetical protein